jgi:nitrate reductase alpha subunit
MQASARPGPAPIAGRGAAEKRDPAGAGYRERWRWDRVVKGTHLLNCWYQRNCTYNVYVKNGAVAFEEPAGEYPRTNSSVPDFNPRGCQKGACLRRQHEPARSRDASAEANWCSR